MEKIYKIIIFTFLILVGFGASVFANGADVFYDDFSAGKIDLKRWTIDKTVGGRVFLAKDGAGIDAASITLKGLQFKEGVIEYSATAETGYETRCILGQTEPADQEYFAVTAYSSAYKGAQHCIAVKDVVKVNYSSPIMQLKRYDYRIIVSGGKIIFERYSEGFVKKLASVEYQAAQLFLGGGICFKTTGTGRGKNITKIHWVRVTKTDVPIKK